MTAIANPGTELEVTMSAEDAQAFDRALQVGGAELALRIYILHRQGGYRHLANKEGVHYDTIESYAEDRIDMPKSTVFSHIKRVEVTLQAMNVTAEEMLKAVVAKGQKQKVLLPTTVTRVLQQLPSAELRSGAYKTMQELKGSQTMTDAEYQAEWKKLVKRTMQEQGFAPADGHVPPFPPETVAPATTNGKAVMVEPTKKAPIQANVVSTPEPASAPSVLPGAIAAHSDTAPPLPMFDDNGNETNLPPLKTALTYDGDFVLTATGVDLAIGNFVISLTGEQVEELYDEWNGVDQSGI
jgi:hypothetical protein